MCITPHTSGFQLGEGLGHMCLIPYTAVISHVRDKAHGLIPQVAGTCQISGAYAVYILYHKQLDYNKKNSRSHEIINMTYIMFMLDVHTA